MSDKENLAVLRRMYDEGRITDDEYENLTGDQLDSVTPEIEQTIDADDPSDPDDAVESKDEEEASLFPPRLKTDISPNYLGGLGMAGMALIVVSALDMLPWTVAIVGILTLFTTLVQGWRFVTLGGAGLVALLLVVTLILAALDDPDPQPVAAAEPSVEAVRDPEPGSLGIYLDEVSELWNTVDAPPRITKGLVRNNEIGEYDTFIYRFGGGLSVAGAFDPDTEAVYALLVNGAFGDSSTEQLYLHACFMVAPYSQECIDSYWEEGLDGGTLEDFTDLGHTAEWTVNEHTWRLEIAQNTLAIRVYGEDAA